MAEFLGIVTTINMVLEEGLIHIIINILVQLRIPIQEILISILQITMRNSIRTIWMPKGIMMTMSKAEISMLMIIRSLQRLKRNLAFQDSIHFQAIRTRMLIPMKTSLMQSLIPL